MGEQLEKLRMTLKCLQTQSLFGNFTVTESYVKN